MNGAMSTITFSNLLSLTFAFFVAIIYGVFLHVEFWAGVAALPVLLIGIVFVQKFQNLATVFFVAGTPTIFIFANNYLDSVPFLRVERALIPLFVMVLFLPMVLRKQKLQRLLAIAEVVKDNLVVVIQGFLLPYAAFFIARHQRWSDQTVTRLLWALMLAGMYLVAAGILQYYFSMTFFFPKYLVAPEFDRASGTLVNPSHYGLILSTFLFLSITLFVRSQDALKKGILLMFMVLFVFGLVISKTRAPWLGALMGLAWLFVLDRRTRPLLVTGGVLAIVALVISLPWLIDSGVMRQRVFEIESMFPRLAAYTTALNIIAQNPILGLGIGPGTFFESKIDYGTTFGLISPYWTRFASVPHNEFLHIFVLMGASGFIPFIVILKLLSDSTRLRASDCLTPESNVRGDLAISCQAILVAYIVNGMLVDILLFRDFLLILFFTFGVLASLNVQVKEHPKQS
jgi:O-antigen ligase